VTLGVPVDHSAPGLKGTRPGRKTLAPLAAASPGRLWLWHEFHQATVIDTSHGTSASDDELVRLPHDATGAKGSCRQLAVARPAIVAEPEGFRRRQRQSLPSVVHRHRKKERLPGALASGGRAPPRLQAWGGVERSTA